MNNTDTSSIIPVMFTQSYQWKASSTACNQTRIYNLPSVPVQIDILKCVSNSSLCGGFSPLETKGDCTDSSISLNSRSAQLSDVQNITAGSKFCVAFQSINWRTIRSPSCSFNCFSNGSRWSIGCCVNLTIRSEGFINTPPVATIISPIRVPVNSRTNIKIPVIDGDNDVVRCRWAKITSTLDECGGICGVIPGSTLNINNCTLIFNSTGKTVGDYYAVALMVEDFSNTSMNTSFSSVPVQFLIEIVNASSCLSKPKISSSVLDCISLRVGTPFSFIFTITQGCPNTTIVDFFTTPLLSMNINNLTQNVANNTWYVAQNLIPNVQQHAPQVYCAVAIDSDGIQSDQYCLTFNAASFGQILLCSGESAVTTTTTTTISTISSAASARTIIQTVVVPDTSNTGYQLSDLDLALGLGLGLPLLFISGGLILFKCCCKQCTCKSISSMFSRRHDTRTETNNNHTKSTQKSINDTKENKDLGNQLPDYRQQYVNDGHKSRTNNQPKISNEKRLLTLDNSLPSMPSPGLRRNSMNVTTTTFFSPSTRSLATNDVQLTKDYSLESTKSMNHGSLLVRAYCNQENQKSILQEKFP